MNGKNIIGSFVLLMAAAPVDTLTRKADIDGPEDHKGPEHDIRKRIKIAMCNSFVNYRYYDDLAQEYNKTDERTRLLLALFSVLTTESVAVRLLSGLYILDFLILITALITAGLAVYGLESKIKLATDLANSHDKIADMYELLYNNLMSNVKLDYNQEYLKILKESQRIKDDPRIPMDPERIKRLQLEVEQNMRVKGYI